MLRLKVEENSTSKLPSMPSPAVDNGSSRKTFHYSKLPEETVTSAFANWMALPLSATVADLKLGVQNVFDHMPNDGPDKISWIHVWGHFCLSYGDQKLIQDTDLIVNYGIKDADQLHFIRHVSTSTNSIKIPKSKETVPQNHSYQLLVDELEDEKKKKTFTRDRKGCTFLFQLNSPNHDGSVLAPHVCSRQGLLHPLGKFMDERDAAIKKKLSGVKDTSEEVKQLEEQANAIMRAARAEISAA
ncbi:ATP synthase subunit b' [Hibiscus syriacus]|uniref:ATP synthase subunit b n=1 Tax=Hibiscus syriacus TaxID=106335 RepID=A0A6A2Z984_HIBSY|nr:ATP synthase subunit b' [Hibiscus syriacus]